MSDNNVGADWEFGTKLQWLIIIILDEGVLQETVKKHVRRMMNDYVIKPQERSEYKFKDPDWCKRRIKNTN